MTLGKETFNPGKDVVSDSNVMKALVGDSVEGLAEIHNHKIRLAFSE